MSKPDSVPERCTASHNESKVKVEARGRRAVFSNSERASILVIDVDCWLSEVEGIKADHVLVKSEIVDVVVELKGSDISHAVQQILATADSWRRASGNQGMMGGLVVCTHSPQNSASLANTKLRVRLKNRIHLEVDKNGKTEYRFENFSGRKS